SHVGPAYRAPEWVAIAITHTANVSTAPTADGTGTPRTVKGTRYGRRRVGSLNLSLITASCAAVKASRTPKLNRLARNNTGWASGAVPTRSAIEINAADTIDCGATSVRARSIPNFRGSWPCSPSE